MGYETKCRVQVDDGSGKPRTADATVLLETDELVVRGEARVKVPRREVQSVTRRGGVVTVTAPTATVKLTLGEPAATKWEQKLKEPPKRLIDKLDVKPGAKVWLLEAASPDLEAQIGERTANVTRANRRATATSYSSAWSATHSWHASIARWKRCSTTAPSG